MTEANADVDSDVEVAIVGAGPAGLVLGIQLAQQGRSVVIAEQRPSPYTLPRAVHFDHEVGRILQSCGIGDELREVAEPAGVYEWQSAAGATLLRFGGTGTAMSGWPSSSMFCQPDLEALLAKRTEELPTLTIWRGARVRSIEQGERHVKLGCVPVKRGPDNALVEVPEDASQIRAAYAVGCDGANSTVRNLLGIDMDDRGFFYDC